MKHILIATLLFVFSSAQAKFAPIHEDQAPAILKSLSQKVYDYVKTQKPKNCIMPYQHSIGFLYDKGNGLQSIDYFFQVPDGAFLEIPISVDTSNNSYLVEQIWPTRQHKLVVSLDTNNKVLRITALISVSATQITVRCQ